MAKRKTIVDQQQEVDFTRLATNYENHSKNDEVHFKDIKDRLDKIDGKLDMWSIKVSAIGGGMGIITTIIVLLLTRQLG